MDEPIAAMVERELGTAPDSVASVETGLFHDTYEVRCGGDAYVVQVAGEDGERVDALARGLGCYRLLQDAPVPVPPVVTETVRTLEGRRYGVVERLPGEVAERDVSPAKVRDAGRHLARIHDARRFDTAGQLRFDDGTLSVEPYEAGSLRERLRARLDEVPDTLSTGGMEVAAAAVERVREDLVDGLPRDVRPVLCHNDYSADNVLFEDGSVTGVLDFDFARADHVHRDLAKAANGFWMHDPAADWAVRETFYDGYREVGDPGERFDRHEPLYRAETHAGTIAGMLERDRLSASEREFYTGTVVDAVERIPTE